MKEATKAIKERLLGGSVVHSEGILLGVRQLYGRVYDVFACEIKKEEYGGKVYEVGSDAYRDKFRKDDREIIEELIKKLKENE